MLSSRIRKLDLQNSTITFEGNSYHEKDVSYKEIRFVGKWILLPFLEYLCTVTKMCACPCVASYITAISLEFLLHCNSCIITKICKNISDESFRINSL